MDQVFRAGNLLALVGWASLLASLVVPPPGRKLLLRLAGWVLPLLFAVAYVVLLGTAKDLSGGFNAIGQVRALFSSDAALTAGWLHYLAFDLFVGTWIVRDGLDRNVWRLALAPCLVLTFLFGPAGFLLYNLLRAALFRPKPATAA